MNDQFGYTVVLPLIGSAILFGALWFYFSFQIYKQFPHVKDVRAIVAEACGGSKYLLTRGAEHGTTDFFFDMDLSITDPSMVRTVIDWYVAIIEKIRKESGGIDRIAFMEKDSGPIGPLMLAGILIEKTNIPGIIVRLRRRLLLNSFKGSEFKKGDRVILVSDLLTTGGGIKSAVDKLKASGLEVSAAVVLVSRMKSERVKDLENVLGINLFYAIEATNKDTLPKEAVKRFFERFKKRGSYANPINNSTV